MNTAFLLVIVLVILVGCGLALLGGAKGDVLPYVKNASLFSAAERSFLGVLDQAAPPAYRVFGKVRIADVISVRKLANRGAWQRAFNKISGKHFDYVLCRADDLSFACVVELDDKSHAKQQRKQRDSFVEEVCSVTGLPLLRVPARHAYAVEDIRQQLHALLPPPLAVGEPATILATPPLAPACPTCSGAMQKRKLNSGSGNGVEFWGCDDFPTCRGMIPIA